MKKNKKRKPDFSKPSADKGSITPESKAAGYASESAVFGKSASANGEKESAFSARRFYFDTDSRDLPLVAIAGRPNVGKSTLFNRFMRRRLAIVDPAPGVTRDVAEGTAFINGKPVRLADTGGFKLEREVGTPEAEMDALVVEKALAAIHKADLILLLLEAGKITPEDEELISLLRPLWNKVLAVVNKCEGGSGTNASWNYLRFGFKELFFISASHGDKISELAKAITEKLATSSESAPPAEAERVSHEPTSTSPADDEPVSPEPPSANPLNHQAHLADSASSSPSDEKLISSLAEAHLQADASSSPSDGKLISAQAQAHLADSASSSPSGEKLISSLAEAHLQAGASSSPNDEKLISAQAQAHLADSASSSPSDEKLISAQAQAHLQAGASSSPDADESVSPAPPTASADADSLSIKIAIVGKPNTGKSTLANRLTHSDRSIVSKYAGTTRDVVEGSFSFRNRAFQIADTAGIRRKSKVKDDVEYYSVNRAIKTLNDCDIVFLLIDAEEGLSEQDKKICSLAYEKGRGIIFVLNKWDLKDQSKKTLRADTDYIKIMFGHMSWAPILPLSALNGTGVKSLLETALRLHSQLTSRIETSALNRALKDWLFHYPPPASRAIHFKIRYMTQTSVNPVSFRLFATNPEKIPESYIAYLKNRIRQDLGFEQIPILLELKASRQKWESRFARKDEQAASR